MARHTHREREQSIYSLCISILMSILNFLSFKQSFRKVGATTDDEQNSNGKRTIPFNGGEQTEKDSKDQSEIVPYTNKKLRTLMTDRQEKSDK